KLNGINLTKIQCMPILGKPYQYAFNIDVVWEDYDNYKDALNALNTKAELVKVHGEYKKGNIPAV
ncbi:MAG: prephenate dehydratase, partial [Reichenbachiella sp.]